MPVLTGPEYLCFDGSVVKVVDVRESGWCRAFVKSNTSGAVAMAAGMMRGVRDGQQVKLKYLFNDKWQSLDVKSFSIVKEPEQPKLFSTFEEQSPVVKDDSVHFSGTVDKVIYSGDKDFMVIDIITPDAGKKRITGEMPGLKVGMEYDFEGKYFVNHKYGKTFKVSSFSMVLPDIKDRDRVVAFLSTSLVKGIGECCAKRIVEHFGDETIDVITNNPEKLTEVSGIGNVRSQLIHDTFKENVKLEPLIAWCSQHHISVHLTKKIYEEFGDQAVDILEENPYVLSDSIKYVGFKKCDEIALSIGIPDGSPFRIRAGISYCLENNADNGNTFMPKDQLIPKVASKDFLDLPIDLVAKEFKYDDTDTDFLVYEDRVYLKRCFNAERYVASSLNRLISSSPDPVVLKGGLSSVEDAIGLKLTEEQKAAVLMSCNSSFSVITGGPGVGKTATTKALINVLSRNGGTVMLCAPTGKAANRLSSVTGKEASTIHRMLKFSLENGYLHNAENPLMADTIIVDESSMIDIFLMRHLLEAVANGTRVVLIGDVDQLPSIGAGNVLRDIINSHRVPVSRLTHVFRQKEDSDIIENAYRINAGLMPTLSYSDDKGFRFGEFNDREVVGEKIVSAVRYLVEKKNISKDDIQVLSPMKRQQDPIATATLNNRLQELLNPDGKELAKCGNFTFRKGDRVIQTKNNYELNVFNGDVGTVVCGYNPEQTDGMVLGVDFSGQFVQYSTDEIRQLELAYACTVHKSQGSEYPYVIMPIHSSQFVMLERSLFYTAVTRAKNTFIMLGEKKAVETAVSKNHTFNRRTSLCEFLVDGVKLMNNKSLKTKKVSLKM